MSVSHSIGSTRRFTRDVGDHQVANIFGGDAAGGSDVFHGFPVATVERDGDAHLLAIVGACQESRVRPG